MHGRDRIALSLHSHALSPDCSEVSYCCSSRATTMRPLEVASKDKDFVLGKRGDVLRRIPPGGQSTLIFSSCSLLSIEAALLEYLEHIEERLRKLIHCSIEDLTRDLAVVSLGDSTSDAGKSIAVTAERHSYSHGTLEVGRIQERSDCRRHRTLTAVLPSVGLADLISMCAEVVFEPLLDIVLDLLLALSCPGKEDCRCCRLCTLDSLRMIVCDGCRQGSHPLGLLQSAELPAHGRCPHGCTVTP